MAITLWVRVEFSSSQVAALQLHQHNISTKHTVCKSVARHPSVYCSLDVQQKNTLWPPGALFKSVGGSLYGFTDLFI